MPDPTNDKFIGPPKPDYIQNNKTQASDPIKPSGAQKVFIERQRKWLENWYRNRVLPVAEYDKDFSEKKSERLNNLKDLSYTLYPEQAVEDLSKVYTLGKGKPTDIGFYYTGNNKIYLSPKAIKTGTSNIVHEATHKAERGDPKGFDNAVINRSLRSREDFKNNFGDDKYYDYLSNPSEVHGRLMEMRYRLGLKPDEIIGLDRLYKITNILDKEEKTAPNNPNNKANNSMKELYMISNDLEGLMDMLNLVTYNEKRDKAEQV